jgi:ABC-type antimicrobial peptide transport system permease subunit
MTFNQLVWKMAKGNKGKYLFYYLCNSFAVFFFFMYSTIYFNDSVVAVKESESIKDALSIPGAALVFFTVFFITYAHRIFTRRRKKEFALLMTLGMSKRDIAKLLLVENALIAFASIVSGILTGMVFSRLLFLLFIKFSGLGEVPFHLSQEMIVYSILTYLAIFLISVFITLYLTLRRTVSHNLKSDKVADMIKGRSPVFGLLGVILLIGSVVLLYCIFAIPSLAQGDAGGYLLLSTLGIFMSLYIVLSQGMSFLIKKAKKHKSYYFKRMLALSNLEYKFNQLVAIMLLITIMSMVTIFYTSMMLIVGAEGERQAINSNPYDLFYAETETRNTLTKEELFNIVDKPENPVEDYEKVNMFIFYQDDPYWEDAYYDFTFMGISDFNRIMDTEEILSEDELLEWINRDPKYVYDEGMYENGLILMDGNNPYQFKRKKFVMNDQLNSHRFTPYSLLVVHDKVFQELSSDLVGDEVTLHLLNFKDWKQTEVVVEELKNTLENLSQNTLPFKSVREIFSEEDELEIFQPVSKISAYNVIKISSKIMFLVSTFISILFFFGSFILLYLTIFSNIEEEKAKYKKLFKIGITKKEMQTFVSKEMGVLFFFAPILGCTIAFIYILSFSQDVGGIMENLHSLLHFASVSGVYLTIQSIYYFYSRKKLLQELEF